MQLLTVSPARDFEPRAWEVDIETPYSEASIAQLKALPGIRWLEKGRRWRGPVEAVRLAVATLEGAGVVRAVWNAPGALPEPFALTSDWRYLSIDTLGMSLRNYQRDGVAWLRHMLLASGGALLADEMGIGKTPQAIAALDEVAPEGRIIIVCQAVAVQNWERLITTWGTRFGLEGVPEPDPERKLRVAERDAWRAASRRWRVTSYDKLKHLLDVEAAAVVFDEIHYLASPSSGRSKTAREWCARNPGAMRVGLSGTPMTSEPSNLWHPLDLLHPGRWGTKFQFDKRYCGMHQTEIRVGGGTKTVWELGRPSHVDELRGRLESVMLRRTKAEVAIELPALTRQVVEVELPPKARSGSAAFFAGLTENRAGIVAALSASEDHKIDAAITLARECVASGSKPLVLTLRRETAHHIAGALLCPVATGEDAPDDRQGILEAPGAPAGVATLASVTTSIDLLSFDVVIFVGLDWVPANMLQGEARAHRFGQRRGVTVYYLVGLGTVDELVRERVIDRLDTFGRLTGGDSTGGFGDTLKGGTEEELLADLVSAILGDTAA